MSEQETDRVDFAFQKRHGLVYEDLYGTWGLTFSQVRTSHGVAALTMMKDASLYFCCLPHIVIDGVSLARVPLVWTTVTSLSLWAGCSAAAQQMNLNRGRNICGSQAKMLIKMENEVNFAKNSNLLLHSLPPAGTRPNCKSQICSSFLSRSVSPPLLPLTSSSSSPSLQVGSGGGAGVHRKEGRKEGVGPRL